MLPYHFICTSVINLWYFNYPLEVCSLESISTWDVVCPLRVRSLQDGAGQEAGVGTTHSPRLQRASTTACGGQQSGGGEGKEARRHTERESGKERKYRGEVTGLAGAKGDDLQPRLERAVRKNKNK